MGGNANAQNLAACYALAKLNAKQHVKDLAGLLEDEYRRRHAAKALAVFGAKEYPKDIAKLIEDTNSLVRCDALIALAILDARGASREHRRASSGP
jgi:HEAT repeat protein